MGFLNDVKSLVAGIPDDIQRATGYRERLATPREESQARKVFQNTLPYGRIWISNGLGAARREYTIPRPLGSPDNYLIHLGPVGFADAGGRVVINQASTEQTFVHELTHVWQGHNSRFPPGYIFNSLWHQATQQAAAYAYTPGQSWRSYNVEQQAKIVEDWWWRYGGNQNLDNPRWPYVRDNIRGLQP